MNGRKEIQSVSRLLRFVVGAIFSALSASACAGAGNAASAIGETHARDTAGNTPLHRAALRGDAEAVEDLLVRGADPNALNQAGATPLHYGIGSERVVAALLARGANPNVFSHAGVTPIFGAVARMDSFAVVRQLVDAGADVNVSRKLPTETIGGGTVLSGAIFGGDQRTISLLLDPKTALEQRQFSPGLVAAALVGDLQTTRALIERGADLNTISGQTGTALNAALLCGHNDVVMLLLEHGANPSVKTIRGYGTPPIVLSTYNDACDASMAKLLLERGVDIEAANDIGDTALSYALKQGSDTELVRFLRERGAKPPATLRVKAIPSRVVPANEARATLVRESAQRAIDLLQRSSKAFLESGLVRNQSKCISCHQQSLPALAYGFARERGLRVDEHEIGRQLVAKANQRSSQSARALELISPTGGTVLTIGHDAEELHALRFAPNDITAAMSHYLLGVQATNGSWSTLFRRVPMSDGAVVATAWGVRAVQLYPPAERKRDAEASVRRAREWLSRQAPPTLNERVFQLLGLAWANETKEAMRPFAVALAQEQRPDGGWSQLPGIASDAWATGSVLHALYRSGMMTSEAIYRRGVDFLLCTQFDDGSWWVRSRAWPFQPHFDSAFPHGRDQWISAAGTAWAAAALLLTLEPTVPPADLRDGQQLMAAFLSVSVIPERGPGAGAIKAASSAELSTVDFTRDIQPLFERSCADCHHGTKPKGSFSLHTRESLLKGGQSGEPAVVPGSAEKSALLRYVSGQTEDMEMPPINRREKYPAFSPAEIDRLRIWIDAGAPWAQSAAPSVTQTPAILLQ